MSKEIWEPGEAAVFTYSLPADPMSDISNALHPRKGQTVEVLERSENDAEPGSTFAERCEAGMLHTYTVRFPDGYEDTALEDELEEVR